MAFPEEFLLLSIVIALVLDEDVLRSELRDEATGVSTGMLSILRPFM